MKKRILVGILVLAMLGSSVAGIVALWPSLNPKNEDPFADVPYPVIQSFDYADLSGQDLTEVDLTVAELPQTLSFSTSTKWPPADKMPDGFSPDDLMEGGRYLGLGLDRLHRQGITGKGISVAVIDRPILKDHEELADNLIYDDKLVTEADSAAVSFHGAATTGIMAGKNGVAPDAKVYYYAIPNNDLGYVNSALALDKIIALNKTLSQSEKIRIVATAQSRNPLDETANVAGAKDWAAAIDRAEGEGLMVVHPSMAHVELTGAGLKVDALAGKAGGGTREERDDPDNYAPWTWTTAKAWTVEKIRAAGVTSWEGVRKELVRLLTEQPGLNSLQAEALNTYIYLAESYKQTSTFESWIAVAEGDLSKALAIPVDRITVATAEANDSYTYYGSGGLSWASPYVAGLLALGLQVNPSAVAQDLFLALMDSGTPFATGGKLVNPVGFIQMVEGLK